MPLFAGLGPDSLTRLIERTSVARFADGATLFLQDDEADRFYVLLDGWVKLYRLSEDGTQALVTVVAPGETFAEAAVFASARYPVCAEAVGDATALVIPRRELTAALAADPQVALAMLASLSLRLRHLVERIEHLQVRSAPQRLAEFLLRLCPDAPGPVTVSLPFAKALVAQRLGMRPETLSRALATLRRHGVSPQQDLITVENVDRLLAFCTTRE